VATDERIDVVQFIIEAMLAMTAPVDEVVISVDVYVRGGQPDERRGVYGALRSDHIDRRVVWADDGTPAGRALASSEPMAVVMLGTAIGVGFAPDPRSVRPVVPKLRIG
jgi:hypothetical protein